MKNLTVLSANTMKMDRFVVNAMDFFPDSQLLFVCVNDYGILAFAADTMRQVFDYPFEDYHKLDFEIYKTFTFVSLAFRRPNMLTALIQEVGFLTLELNLGCFLTSDHCMDIKILNTQGFEYNYRGCTSLE